MFEIIHKAIRNVNYFKNAELSQYVHYIVIG